jgi:malonate decarboxylase epsilon subunit
MSVAFLYPGQGAQHPGMLRAIPASPAATTTLQEAAAELDDRRWPGGLADLDTVEALRSTTNAQLALLISGVAAARAVTDDHGLIPDFVAGHSVGAFAAAVTAGVLTLGEAIAAVRLRGDLMQHVCATRRWGMAAVLGLGATAVHSLADRVGTPHDPVWVANINAADQIVLSGTTIALEQANAAARGAGARRFEPLDVTIASHCPLQAPTAARIAAHLAHIQRRTQRIAYFTNTRGRRVHDDSAAVLDDLSQAVAQPVQWYDSMRLMWELGARCGLQMPPGHTLVALAVDSTPDMRLIALDEVGLERAVAACASGESRSSSG